MRLLDADTYWAERLLLGMSEELAARPFMERLARRRAEEQRKRDEREAKWARWRAVQPAETGPAQADAAAAP